MNDQPPPKTLRRLQRLSNELPGTVNLSLLGFIMTPGLAFIDIFIDFPAGEQTWQGYLVVWPVLFVMSTLFGLLADGFMKVFPEKEKPVDIPPSDRVRRK